MCTSLFTAAPVQVLKTMDLPKSPQGWFKVAAAPDCFLHQVKSLRFMILNNHGGGNSRVSGIRCSGVQLSDWDCALCGQHQINSVMTCTKCTVRRPVGNDAAVSIVKLADSAKLLKDAQDENALRALKTDFISGMVPLASFEVTLPPGEKDGIVEWKGMGLNILMRLSFRKNQKGREYARMISRVGNEWGAQQTFTVLPGAFKCGVDVTARGFVVRYESSEYYYEHRLPWDEFDGVSARGGAAVKSLKSSPIAALEGKPSAEENEEESDDSEEESDDESDSDGDDSGSAQEPAGALEAELNREAVPVSPSDGMKMPPIPPAMGRNTSIVYWAAKSFEPIESLDTLIVVKDVDGNTAAHHAGFCGMKETYNALVSAGAPRWLLNKHGESPAGLAAGVRGSPRLFSLFKACRKRKLLDAHWQGDTVPPLTAAALRCPADYDTPRELHEVCDLLAAAQPEDAVDVLCSGSLGIVHEPLYRALAVLFAGYGAKSCDIEADIYVSNLLASGPDAVLDPAYFYLQYYLWKETGKVRACLHTLCAYHAFIDL